MRVITRIDQNEKIAVGPRPRETVREKLEAERRGVYATLDLALRPGEELAEGWQERDSPAERELREIEFLHRESLLARLRLISDAIERIESGSYSLCYECGRKIEKKRLKNDPAVALCLRCQQSAENLQTN